MGVGIPVPWSSRGRKDINTRLICAGEEARKEGECERKWYEMRDCSKPPQGEENEHHAVGREREV
jgi:hypothetical protein